MLNKVYQVPYGTKDILPGEMKRRRKIENAILDIFENWGYEEVKTPGFEYADTFGSMVKDSDFRFFDRNNNFIIGGGVLLSGKIQSAGCKVYINIFHRQILHRPFHCSGTSGTVHTGN